MAMCQAPITKINFPEWQTSPWSSETQQYKHIWQICCGAKLTDVPWCYVNQVHKGTYWLQKATQPPTPESRGTSPHHTAGGQNANHVRPNGPS